MRIPGVLANLWLFSGLAFFSFVHLRLCFSKARADNAKGKDHLLSTLTLYLCISVSLRLSCFSTVQAPLATELRKTFL